MLNLWIGYKDFENLEDYPDIYFDSYFEDLEKLETDFAKRVITTCSDVAEVINYKNMVRNNGMLISPRELSTGAKTLILIKYTDLVLNASRLGENCELFLKEIADEKDVTLITTRYFNPFLLCDYDKVRILNTGDIVTTSREFLGVYYNNDLNIELYGE